jgi:murein DD-endopeptidase MepM/ murein hydrolase activator NlpD
VRYNSRLELDYKHTSKRKSASKKYRILAASALLSILVIVPIGAYSLFISEKTTPKHHVVEQSDSTHEEYAVNEYALNIETIPLLLADQGQHSPKKPQITPAQRTSDQTSDNKHFIQQISDHIESTEAEKAPEVFSVKKHTKIIKTGDNLSNIFTSLGLNTELHKILQLGEPVKELKSIYPQQKIHFYLQDDSLIKLELETSLNRQLQIIQQHESYVVNEVIRDFEIQTQSVHAVIENSLFLAGQRAGLSDAVIMQLANICGWDIDFALDIRSGDQFSVIYQEKFLDGRKVKDGEILIAEFINSGKSFRAIRYTDSNNHTDYYSDNGHSMRKPFLRTPVDFARVSSKFNLKRLHPVLNTIRAHKGVDYAAATGTPIKSAGDGKVIFRGTKGGYGRTVIIQHGSQYSTLYAHMHKYANRTQKGARVKQGQIIGYVGKSGLATGPHLHYEFRVNGVHRNPLTVKLPDAQPLPETELIRFHSKTQTQFALLDTFKATMIASNEKERD